MEHIAGYTRTELVAEAKRKGFRLTERKITDWSSKGLIAMGGTRGTGRGSAPSVRSENQARLLWQLLDKWSQPGLTQLPVLANVPVAVWLIWGDEYVALPQVRRAMKTWAYDAAKASMRRLRVTYKDLVAEWNLAGLKQADSTGLLKQLAALTSGAPVAFDDRRDALRTEICRLFGATGTALEIPAVEAWLDVVDARVTGMQLCQDTASVDEREFIIARQRIRSTSSTYNAHLGLPAESVRDDQITDACLHLATTIGFRALQDRTSNTTDTTKDQRDAHQN